jgi:2,4-dienoyl-CoA reductase-like NADH-dependent reductase (Old Yellow Enzyme family)
MVPPGKRMHETSQRVEQYPNLFSEIKIAGSRLRNRIALPATVTNLARQNRITEGYKNFLIERAKGGVGMLISEVIAVDPNAIAQPAIVTGFDDANDADFADLASRVNREGAALVGQLWHPGKQQLWGATSSPMGVSNQPDAYSWTVPRVMTNGEIEGVVSAYINVAAKLSSLGYNGVELHGAHGYLINQFLSPWSNLREDLWGGSVENRIRFAVQIAHGIKTEAGKDFIVGLKMPGTEEVEGGIDPDEAERLTKALTATGAFDYFAYGQGNFSLSLESHVPDINYKPGHFLEIHKKMKKAAAGVPVMALGRISTPEEAESALTAGQGDLIGMTRALIADPDWPKKAEAGVSRYIRPTTFDNVAWGLVHQGKPLSDHLNPLVGLAGESGWTPPQTKTPKTIAVVGAGPAGLQAAWIAAARGHDVTLFGRRLGGALDLEKQLPGRSDMGRIIAWQKLMAEDAGVKFRLGRLASEDEVRDSADTIILATGADQRWPESLAPTNEPVLSAREFDIAKWTGRKHRVILFDQDQTAAVYGLADLLASQFKEVVLMTPRPQFAEGVNYCSSIGVFRRLYSAGSTLLPAAIPVAFKNGNVSWSNPYIGSLQMIEDVDLLIYATPRSPRLSLSYAMQDLDLIRVGDCQSPRPLIGAIHSGHAAGLQV